MKKWILATCIASAFFATPVFAKPVPKPDIIKTPYGEFDAYGKLLISNETALKSMNFKDVQKQAKQNHPQAQFNLAKMYEMGIHTPKDINQALKWYKQAAHHGHTNAMNNLAVHLSGQSANQYQFSHESLVLLEKSAQANNPHAMLNLANYYIQTQKETQKGIDLIIKTGEQGYAPAYYVLGSLYHEGKEVKEDKQKAFAYFTQSAQMGYVHAQTFLAVHYQKQAIFHSVDLKDKAQPIILSYQWGARACRNGKQDACQIVEFLEVFKTRDLSTFKHECDTVKESENKKNICEIYSTLKDIQDKLNKEPI